MENLADAQMNNDEHLPQIYDMHMSHDIHDHGPKRGERSVMREFLESDVDWTWPSGLGEVSGNHCDFRVDIKGIPLSFKKKISDKKASIDLYETHPDYNYDFKKPFVVKTIRESSSKRARDEAANEVNTMKDLRHPHITALLATFMYQERLNILIFPAACCDLHQFMKQMSKDFQDIRSPGRLLDGLSLTRTRSNSTITTDSTTSISHPHQGQDSSVTEKRAKSHHSSKKEAWPLNASLQQKIHCLRRYFVCLSEALRYLHGSDVRHKDIKPENILIDESGAVILTDFGISRRFAKHASHVTNNEWKFTRKYASPEIMKGKRVLRDDPSDVFSLGCVFLEMATLLLGQDLNNFSQHYTTRVNQTGIEEAYYCNLVRVYTWIEFLQTLGTKSDQEQPLQAESIQGQDHASDPEQSMVEALTHIREMLDENPQIRPNSRDLWSCFRFINPEKCRDCDPSLEERWKPSIKQQQNAKAGLNRRSIISEDDVIPESREPLPFEGIDRRLLSPTSPVPKSRRVSSPNMGLNDISRQDYPDMSSRPSSPKYQPRVDNQATSPRNSRTLSPTINGIQQGEKTTRRDIRRSATALPTNRPHNPDAGALRQTSVKVDSAPPVPPSRTTSPQAPKDAANVQRGLSPPPNPHRIPPTVQASNPTRPNSRNDITLAPVQDTLPPNTQIIVYDFERRRASLWPSDALNGSYSAFLSNRL